MWKYLEEVLKLKSKYVTGKFGQKIDGSYCYDCVCLIKSFPWCSGKAGATPVYKANGINDDWIGAIYDKASQKGTISTLPKSGIWLVYLNNEHIAVYNADEGCTIECCAGNTMKVVKRPINYYKGTEYDWNKWSNLYWCPAEQNNKTSQPTQPLQPVKPSGSIFAGRTVTLKNTPCYSSESAKTPYGTKSGTFYLWDNVVKNGRIRITNASSRVGVAGQVTCWVNVADIGLTTTTSISKPKHAYQCTYTVKKGDSLWAISTKYLGRGSRYKEIMKLNALKTDVISVGQKIKIPNK